MLSGLYKPAVETGWFFRQEVNCTTQQGGEGKGGRGCVALRAGCRRGWGLCGETLYACMSGLVRTGLTGHL